MRTETLQLEHTETLLDVVFGVVIAVALTDLPGLVEAAITTLERDDLTSVLLLTSSLLFSAFYWLEVRHFIAEQHRFNVAVGEATDEEADSGVPGSLAAMLIGTLLMMTVASAILTYSRASTFRQFLAASTLFWVFDLLGSIVLKRSYRRFEETIRRRRQRFRFEHAWYLGHMESLYFVFYGSGNVVFFLVLFLLLDRKDSSVLRLWLATAILGLTLFRHLAWRSRVYVWYRNKRLRA